MNDEPTTNRTWLEKLSHLLLREPQDREELVELLHDAQDRQLLDRDALRMIQGVMQVSEMQVRDVMIPRSQMITVDHDATLETCLPIVIKSGHSRFPVLNDADEVIGVMLAKDLLRAQQSDKKEFTVEQVLRKTVFIPESKRLNVLLNDFRKQRNHMAIVVDEYGSVSGLVTIEDVLEQIVGDIADEYDIDKANDIQKISESLFNVNGLTEIADFNTYFNTQLSDEEFDTIGGYVTHEFGQLPNVGEFITVDHLKLAVLKRNQRRLLLLRVEKLSNE